MGVKREQHGTGLGWDTGRGSWVASRAWTSTTSRVAMWCGWSAAGWCVHGRRGAVIQADVVLSYRTSVAVGGAHDDQMPGSMVHGPWSGSVPGRAEGEGWGVRNA